MKRFFMFKRQKMLQKVNLRDSIKTDNPDKVEVPGNTWKSALSKRNAQWKALKSYPQNMNR